MLKTSFFLVSLTLGVLFSVPAGAVALPASVPAAEALSVAPVTEPLTVADVIIDKTAKNAVVARNEAMVEAQRVAFQKLAERNMTADAFKTLKLPDDKTIMTLVQDFEIKNEQLSATRYVANFTVRFREGVKNYVNIVMPLAVATEAQAAPTEGTTGGREILTLVSNAPRNILLLPYLESISGKSLLWEDANPWRAAWQAVNPQLKNGKVTIPLGDISDVSAGSSDVVWSGDYSVIEKMRTNYGVDEVILAAANKSGTVMSIDMYSFKGGVLNRLPTLTPVIGEKSEAEAYRQGVDDVLAALANPQSLSLPANTAAAISQELTGASAMPTEGMGTTTTTTTTTVISEQPMIATEVSSLNAIGADVDAAMIFSDAGTWMEMQKRLATIVPPVQLTIRALASDGAQFSMSFPGNVETLKAVLAEKGILMDPAMVMVDPAIIPGSSNAVQRAPYEIRLTSVP